MATSLNLPEGFEIETPGMSLDQAQGIRNVFDTEALDAEQATLPEGFEIEPMDTEMTSPALSADMDKADIVASAPQAPEVTETPKVKSFQQINEEIKQLPKSEIWHSLATPLQGEEPMTLLPFATKAKEDGEGREIVKGAFGVPALKAPEAVRSLFRGIGDWYKQAEELSAGKPIEELTITPDAALLPLAITPLSVASTTTKTGIQTAVKAPSVESPLVKAELTKGQNEALGNVLLGARNPYTQTPEQIQKTFDTAVSKRTAKDIDAEITQIAKDTSVPGAKEKLTALQQEKASLTSTRITPRELTKEQFETNLVEPIANAIDSGVPLETVKQAITEGLTTSMRKKPVEEIDDIIEAALAPYTEIKIPEEQLKAIKGSKTPVVEKGGLFTKPKTLLTQKDVEEILNSRNVNTIRRGVDDFVFQQRFSRTFSNKNNKLYGDGELAAKDSRLAQISAAREVNNNVFTSYVDGAGDGRVYDFINGVQVVNPNVRPLTNIYKDAIASGFSPEDANNLIKAANANSNWERLERTVAEKQQVLTDLKAKLKSTKSDSERAILRAQLKTASADLTTAAEKSTYMSKEEAQAIMDKFGSTPAGDKFLTELKAWTDSMLDMSVRSGLISKEAAASMKAANKQYLPEMRFVEDFEDAIPLASRATTKGTTTGTSAKRKISDVEYNVNPIENLIKKIGQVEHAAMRNEERVQTLYWNLEHMDDSAFKYIYDQPKAKVLEAIEKIKDGKAPRVIDGRELVDTPQGQIASPTNFSIFIDGHRLDLTVKHPKYKEALLRPRLYQRKEPIVKLMHKFAFLTRNSLTTWNPIFQPSAAIKGALGYRANIPADMRGTWREGTRMSFAKVGKKLLEDKDYYDYLKANISPGVLNRGLKNTDKQELIDQAIYRISKPEAKGFKASVQKGLVKTVNGLEEWAEFNEMLIRGRAYEETKATLTKLGNKTPEEIERIAVRVAKNLETNYFAHGSGNALMDFFYNATPFLRTRVNGATKAINSMQHRPQEVAKGIAAYAALIHATTVWNRQFKDTDGVAFVDKLDPSVKENYTTIYLPGATSINDRVQMGSPFNFIRLGNAAEMWADKAMRDIAQRIYDDAEPAIQEAIEANPVLSTYLAENKLEAQDIFAMTMDLLAKDFDPTAFQGLAGLGSFGEVATNVNSQGQPIIPSFMQEYEPYLQVVPHQTSPAVLAVTDYLASKGLTNTNPTLLTYFIKDVAGNIGALMLDGADVVLSAAGVTPELPKKEAGALPGVSRFTGYASEIPQEGVDNQYSNTYKHLKPIVDSFGKLKTDSERGTKEMNRYLDFVEEHAEELALYNEVYKPTNDSLRELYRELNRLSGFSGDTLESDVTPEKEILGDPIKREKINQIRKDIIEYKRAALNELYERRDVVGEVWTKRLRTGMFPKGIIEPFLKNIDKDNKSLDKQSNLWDNFNLISSANAEEASPSKGNVMLDLPPEQVNPPAIVQEQAIKNEEYMPGIFEKFFPNVRKGVVNTNKTAILNRVLQEEGGYVNHPRDKGGATNYGITLATLKQVKPSATVEDIKKLTKDQALDIYKTLYWDEGKIDKLPLLIQDVVFDGNINHGIGGMTKVIQRALQDLGHTNIKVDGVMGTSTLNAMNKSNDIQLRKAILARRESLYRQHKDFDVFGEGWLKRIQALAEAPTTSVG